VVPRQMNSFMVAADDGPRLKHVPGSPCVIVCFQFSYYLVCHWFSGSLIAQIRSPSIQQLQTHYALRSEIHGSKPPSEVSSSPSDDKKVQLLLRSQYFSIRTPRIDHLPYPSPEKHGTVVHHTYPVLLI